MLGELSSGFSDPLLTDQIHVLNYPCDCSSRPWSFFIVFYIFLIFVAGALPFIIGRVINISARLEHQTKTYRESTIWGDLSEADVTAASAQLNSFTVGLSSILGTSSNRTQDYVRTWTLAPFTDRSSLPTAVRLKYNDENVYFAELAQSQVKPDGKGPGTFIQNGTISDPGGPAAPSLESVSEGALLKYVDRAECGTGNSRSYLYMIEYHDGELGCIVKSFLNLRSICK